MPWGKGKAAAAGREDLLAADAAASIVDHTGFQRMTDDTAALILALATENAELRVALAEAQELLIKTAVDAGELHARVEDLLAQLAVLRIERAAWVGSRHESDHCDIQASCEELPH